MTKVRKGNDIIEIENDKERCGNCRYEKYPKCTLFDIPIDHVVENNADRSGYMRPSMCLDAEVKD
ncbi:MAG: hypothetical protein LBU88_01510 [Treponema sp.]|jgi:hypothetical protein|nr:hypothetical protein [Treponema sp.]